MRFSKSTFLYLWFFKTRFAALFIALFLLAFAGKTTSGRIDGVRTTISDNFQVISFFNKLNFFYN